MSSRNRRTLNIPRRKAILGWTERRMRRAGMDFLLDFVMGSPQTPRFPATLILKEKRGGCQVRRRSGAIQDDQLITWAA